MLKCNIFQFYIRVMRCYAQSFRPDYESFPVSLDIDWRMRGTAQVCGYSFVLFNAQKSKRW